MKDIHYEDLITYSRLSKMLLLTFESISEPLLAMLIKLIGLKSHFKKMSNKILEEYRDIQASGRVLQTEYIEYLEKNINGCDKTICSNPDPSSSGPLLLLRFHSRSRSGPVGFFFCSIRDSRNEESFKGIFKQI